MSLHFFRLVKIKEEKSFNGWNMGIARLQTKLEGLAGAAAVLRAREKMRDKHKGYL